MLAYKIAPWPTRLYSVRWGPPTLLRNAPVLRPPWFRHGTTKPKDTLARERLMGFLWIDPTE
jgi:hypothetical protein